MRGDNAEGMSHGRWPVNMTSVRCADEAKDKCGYKGKTIAQHQVFPFQAPQAFKVVPVEIGEVGVACHGKRPQGI